MFMGILLGGCATPYQESGYMGGIKHVEIDEGRYKIEFLGNSYTSDARARDHANRRSDELCRNGYEILEEKIVGYGLFGEKPNLTRVVQCKN